ncbi:MAG: glycosyltransferase [Myxococcota bacterium]|nr:glycosyltransferase [Myxococcota bacterium]
MCAVSGTLDLPRSPLVSAISDSKPRSTHSAGQAGEEEQTMAAQKHPLSKLGLVLIGRNEGERLRLGLESVPEGVGGVVYVDSGSTDGSVELAESHGVAVVNLDMSRPFTAARARNEGFERLMHLHDNLDWVHFVDGDCSLVEGWIETAMGELTAHPDWISVCGYRRERYPENSIYNRWCDLEWTQAPTGPIDQVGFGGDVIISVPAFREVGGYNADIIAAEDSELSARLVQTGGEVMRIDRTMTYHDADIRKLSQWWSRSVRCGHAYAEVASRHAEAGVFRRHVRSLVLWGVAIPAATLFFLLVAPLLALLFLGVYPLQIVRIARSLDTQRFPLSHRLLWGVSCLVSQVPKVQGLLKFVRNRRSGVQQTIIEYK